jgi:uncharacterized delta-60 repeat protein
LNPDGSLDTGFHAEPIPEGILNALALQPDGKVLVGGHQGWSGFQAFLVRLNADGSLDPGFTSSAGGRSVHLITVLPDGKLLVGGMAFLVRLNPDGSTDPSFVTDASHWDPFSATVQPDGRILVGGGFSMWNGTNYALARLHSNGRLDTTFASGTITPEFGGGAGVTAIVLQEDGHVLVGGFFERYNEVFAPGLVRLNNDSFPPPFVTRHLLAACLPDSTFHVELQANPPAHIAVYAVEDQPPAGWSVTNVSHGGVYDPSTGKVKFGPFFDAEPRTLTYDVRPPPAAQGVFLFHGRAAADGQTSPVAGDQHLVLVLFHPADCTPADWSLGISEVTAYGAAWRHGQSWVVPPVPIPIDYVTRAAALWRGGECYQVDPSVTNAPLWWVNCATPTAQRMSAATVVTLTAGTAESQLPPVFVPGEPMTVRVSVSPASDGQSYAVEDQPPAGWTVTAITDGGEFDAVNNKVKWGPFLDRQPRILSYGATPPVGAGNLATFAGLASFDGSGVPIAGSRQLRASSRLSVSAGPQLGRVVLCLRGQPGTRYLIEASTDLIQWAAMDTVTCTTDGAQTTLAASLTDAHRFYRARALP